METTPSPITRVGVSGIMTRGNEILLGLRSKNDPSLPGQWCTPGGGVLFREELRDALRREFLEETHLTIHVGGLITVTERIMPDRHSMLVFFRVLQTDASQVPQAGEDFDDIGWFDGHEIIDRKINVTDQTRDAVKVFFDQTFFVAKP